MRKSVTRRANAVWVASFLGILSTVLLSGCHRKHGIETQQLRANLGFALGINRSVGGLLSHREVGKDIAYRHEITLVSTYDRVDRHFGRLRSYCTSMANCEIVLAQEHMLDPSQGTESKQALLSVRLPHDKVAAFVKRAVSPLPDEQPVAFSTQSWTTSAVDTGGELRDSARRLTQLEAYRDRLELLEKKDVTHVDNLIKIARELSKVQSDIEMAKTNASVLNHKVETELVRVTYQSQPRSMGAVTRAWNHCAQLFSESLADVFVFVIQALVWLPLVLVGLFCLHIMIRYRWFAPRR